MYYVPFGGAAIMEFKLGLYYVMVITEVWKTTRSYRTFISLVNQFSGMMKKSLGHDGHNDGPAQRGYHTECMNGMFTN